MTEEPSDAAPHDGPTPGGAMVPPGHRDLLAAKGFAFLATLGPESTPQVSPTWYRWDEAASQLLISLTTGRQKYRNLVRDPRVAVCIPDPLDPYRHLELRGRVEVIERDQDRALINSLTRRYVGQDEHTRDGPDDVRVVVRITPERAIGFGPASADKHPAPAAARDGNRP